MKEYEGGDIFILPYYFNGNDSPEGEREMSQVAKKLHWTQTPAGRERMSRIAAQGRKVQGFKPFKTRQFKSLVKTETETNLLSEYEDLIARVGKRIKEISESISALEHERVELERLFPKEVEK